MFTSPLTSINFKDSTLIPHFSTPLQTNLQQPLPFHMDQKKILRLLCCTYSKFTSRKIYSWIDAPQKLSVPTLRLTIILKPSNFPQAPSQTDWLKLISIYTGHETEVNCSGFCGPTRMLSHTFCIPNLLSHAVFTTKKKKKKKHVNSICIMHKS